MHWLNYLRQAYSLETLDSRLTSSSSTPPKSIGLDGSTDANSSRRAASEAAPTSPPRWRTPEFYIYYLVFVIFIPLMFKVAIDASDPSHAEYAKYEHLLSPGWIPGRKVDNSDTQYSTIRENIPYLFALLIVHPLLRRLYDNLFPVQLDETSAAAALAERRLSQRASFDLRFAIVFLCALHGFSVFKIFLILYLNFVLATQLPRSYVPAATWAFNICVLFANELGNGYPYGVMADFLRSHAADSVGENAANWGSWLDHYGGLMPRWHILFNITVLRLISFNLDRHWSLDQRGASPIEKKQLDPANLSDRDRVRISAPAKDYSFSNYLAYVLYSPLYLAGPILTFNEYIHQLRYRPVAVTTTNTLLYGIRFILALLSMEFILHYIYAVAISKAHPAWEVYTPFQLAMLGYFHLHIIWLKLLIPWRFFRWWALVDGMDPPENMIRCPSDNYSTTAFWRAWHRSFNRWIIRYIYIPLGGSGGPQSHGVWGQVRAGVNFLVIFTFVALWHDISLTLLMWGWLVTLFILPEVLAKMAFPRRRWEQHPTAYRVLSGLGVVANLFMMVTANLVGFALGVDGVKDLWLNILSTSSGWMFLLLAYAAMFTGVQVMFEIREEERRRGIWLRC